MSHAKNRPSWFSWKNTSWIAKTAIATLGVGISCNLISNRVEEMITEKPLSQEWATLFVVSVIALLVGIFCGKSVVSDIVAIETPLPGTKVAVPKKVLVILLSVPTRPKTFPAGETIEHALALLAEEKRLDYLRKQSLPEAERRPTPTWSWEQPFRGIWHNLRDSDDQPGPFSRVVVIASCESIGSVKEFARLVKSLVPPRRELEISVWLNYENGRLKRAEDLTDATNKDAGWAFDKFDLLYKGIVRLLDALHSAGFADGDIALDITGGTKPATVAAAAVSIGREVTAQYVCTSPRSETDSTWDYAVLEYDLKVNPRFKISADS